MIFGFLTLTLFVLEESLIVLLFGIVAFIILVYYRNQTRNCDWPPKQERCHHSYTIRTDTQGTLSTDIAYRNHGA
jgi:hypothetical protein